LKYKFRRSGKIYICIDANLPKIDDCGAVCEKHPLVLCRHHFQYPVNLFYCNDIRFQGAKDLNVLLAFINFLKSKIESRQAGSNRLLFFLVTKDLNFLQDTEKEWQDKGELEPNLDFLGDAVRCNNILIRTIFITEDDFEIKEYEKLQPRAKIIPMDRTQSQTLIPKKDKDRWFRGGFRYSIITKVNKISHSIFSNKHTKV